MKNIQLTVIFFFLSFSLFAQISISEKQALQDLYTSTNGDSWNTSWDLNQPISQWNGVTITNNKVTNIKLLFNNLDGEIPESIGNLTHLETLELSFNKLEGSLPLEIGSLKNLSILALHGNNLSGNIPITIGNLSKLTQLHLSSNQLVGEVPTTVVNLKNLEIFNVFDNDLSGNIPTKLVNSKNLKQLLIAENNFNKTNNFPTQLLSNGASIDLQDPYIIPKSKDIIAIESEEN